MSNNLVVAYIHGGKLDVQFHRSQMAFLAYDVRHRKLLNLDWGPEVDMQSPYLAHNRQQIANAIRENKQVEWILWGDTDIGFNPESPYQLFDEADPFGRPIISGAYFNRKIGEKQVTAPLWFDLTWKDNLPQFSTITTWTGGVQKLGGIGFGFVLTYRRVFERLHEAYSDNGQEEWTCFGHDTGRVNQEYRRLGEDLTFSARCAKLGIPIYGHCGVVVGHTKAEEITLESIFREGTLKANSGNGLKS